MSELFVRTHNDTFQYVLTQHAPDGTLTFSEDLTMPQQMPSNITDPSDYDKELSAIRWAVNLTEHYLTNPPGWRLWIDAQKIHKCFLFAVQADNQAIAED